MKDRMILSLLCYRKFTDDELETFIHADYLARAKKLLSAMISTKKRIRAKDETKGYLASRDKQGIIAITKENII